MSSVSFHQPLPLAFSSLGCQHDNANLDYQNRSEALVEPLENLETIARTRKLMCSMENDDLKLFNGNEPDGQCLKALITAAEAQASLLCNHITTNEKKITEKNLHRIMKLGSDLDTILPYDRHFSYSQVLKTLDEILLHLFSKTTIQLTNPGEVGLKHWSAWRASLPGDCQQAIAQLDKLIMAELKKLGAIPSPTKT